MQSIKHSRFTPILLTLTICVLPGDMFSEERTFRSGPSVGSSLSRFGQQSNPPSNSTLLPNEIPIPSDSNTTTNSQHSKFSQEPMLLQINRAIEVSKSRFLSAEGHTPWQIMHGILGMRDEYTIRQNGNYINAMDYITQNPRFKGEPWFLKSQHGGKAHGYTSPYVFEGHPNQFLAILTMSDLRTDFSFETDHGPITIADLVRNAQMEVNDREEVTWTLWSLSKYLHPDTTWRNKNGEYWSIERLLQIQTQAKVEQAACGGTHGLFAIAQAINGYLRTGRPLRGVWLEADQKLQRYIRLAQLLQNPDGSFSSSYFTNRAATNEFAKRVETSGHTLEILVLALPQERLKEEWITRAIHRVSADLIQNSHLSIKCGPLYHAVSALQIYKSRMWSAKLAKKSDTLQEKSGRVKIKLTDQNLPANSNSQTELKLPAKESLENQNALSLPESNAAKPVSKNPKESPLNSIKNQGTLLGKEVLKGSGSVGSK